MVGQARPGAWKDAKAVKVQNLGFGFRVLGSGVCASALWMPRLMSLSTFSALCHIAGMLQVPTSVLCLTFLFSLIFLVLSSNS